MFGLPGGGRTYIEPRNYCSFAERENLTNRLRHNFSSSLRRILYVWYPPVVVNGCDDTGDGGNDHCQQLDP